MNIFSSQLYLGFKDLTKHCITKVGEHRSSKTVAADTTVAWETLTSPAMEKPTHKH